MTGTAPHAETSWPFAGSSPASLFVRSRTRDRWTIYPGDAAELVKRLERVRAPAFVRTEDGRIVGYTALCDGPCDRSRPHKWHWFYERSAPFVGMDDCPWTKEGV